jgi:hypothetical protein
MVLSGSETEIVLHLERSNTNSALILYHSYVQYYFIQIFKQKVIQGKI